VTESSSIILSLTIWIPILGGLGVIALGNNRSRPLALIVSIITLLVSLPLYFSFDKTTSAMQFVESVAWLPSFDINYSLGVDGISMPLIILTTLINVIVVISAWEVIKDRPAMYLGCFQIMTGLMVGVFSSLDAILFYIFFEATLIPMFLIIGIWGGPNRVYATIKFFLYTFLGSVFMLIALIYLYKQGESFSILGMHYLELGPKQQLWIFLAFFVAFAVKITLGIFIAFMLLENGDANGVALGIEGAIMQMVSHGFISAAMFLCVGVMYDRVHSREISDYGGVINTMPYFGAFMIFFSMANAGLPGTSGFVGEFMVILATFKANFWFAFLAALTLILGAAYTLWMVKRVILGEVANDKVAALSDINRREFWMLASLAVFVLLLGVFPGLVASVMHASVENLVQHISISKY